MIKYLSNDVLRQHPIVGTVGPSVDRLAKALAGKGGTKLQPTGAYAANLLGLSDQVPARVVFLTDGRSNYQDKWFAETRKTLSATQVDFPGTPDKPQWDIAVNVSNSCESGSRIKIVWPVYQGRL